MASPAKRRKKNDYQASPKAVRSLDYFFGKQTKEKENGVKEAAAKTAEESLYDDEPTKDVEKAVIGEQHLTDEELARKLQAEWNDADGAANSSASVAPGEGGKEDKDLRGHIADIDGDAGGGKSCESILEDSASTARAREAPTKDTLSLQSSGTAEDTVSSTIPFDESPLTFSPSKYIPDLQRHWAQEGGDASYALLTRCFVLVNSTQSRIKIVDTLVNLLRVIIEGDPTTLLPTVCLIPSLQIRVKQG